MLLLSFTEYQCRLPRSVTEYQCRLSRSVTEYQCRLSRSVTEYQCRLSRSLHIIFLPESLGHPVALLVEALRYMPEGRGFDSRRCHWNF